MKKTYIQPETIQVEVGTANIIAESVAINRGGGTTIQSSSEILTKERNNKNIWDDQW